MRISTKEKLSLARAVCFSILAPLVFFYNWMRSKFLLPLFLQAILLLGYSFALSGSIMSHTVVITILYSIALFFILLNIIFTVIFWKKRKYF